ncbi:MULTISPECIES: threonine aldolase family protein [unclassified Acinetobacter]|uniref:threonine aldolase family protein n=1 Tax=unclassified Acinetobacter TaxID=196816 RepID=UPI0035BB0546
MYSFLNDYSEGACPEILQALLETNLEQHSGYGLDRFSLDVQDIMASKTANPNSKTFLITGGTQANLVCLDALLRPIEAVMCADTGHIFVNEAGAIEATGHKVVTMPSINGKISVEHLQQTWEKHQHFPHLVKIKAVYITNSTEVGTIYTLSELQAISDFCKQHNLYLMLDGARLGSAMANLDNDISYADLGRLVDIFWLGGTKMGALFGEAIVINRAEIAEDFAVYLKQHGALLAKGRVLGLQFLALLKNDRYIDYCKHANAMAKKLADGLVQKGYRLAYPLATNQVFAQLPIAVAEQLRQDFTFYDWQKLDDEQVVVRLVTSWATDEQQVDKFLNRLA